MRIAFLSPAAELGGAERVLLAFLGELRLQQPNWQLYLITSTNGPMISIASSLGVITKVVALPDGIAGLGDSELSPKIWSKIGTLIKLVASIPSLLVYGYRLKKEVNLIQPNIIHSNGFKMHLLSAWITSKRTSLIWHVHDYLSNRIFGSQLMRLCSCSCKVIITNSNSVNSDVRKTLGTKKRIETIYNPIDLNIFKKQGPRLELDQVGENSKQPSMLKIGLLATFAKWKGHLVFIKAISLISDKVPINAYIIGGPIYQNPKSQYQVDELKKSAQDYNVADRIRFLGFVKASEKAIRALDIIVHASTRPEPFGMVIAESMACGVPVIISNAGGAQEISSLVQNAVTFNPGDHKELARKIIDLVEDKGKRESLSRIGREVAEKYFDVKNATKKLIDLYCDIENGA